MASPCGSPHIREGLRDAPLCERPAKRPRTSILETYMCPVCGAGDVDDGHVNMCLDTGTAAKPEAVACPVCELPNADAVHVNRCLDLSLAAAAPVPAGARADFEVCPVCGEAAGPGHVDKCIDNACPPESPVNSPAHSLNEQRTDATRPVSKAEPLPISDWLGPDFAKYVSAFVSAGFSSLDDLRNVPEPVEDFLRFQCGVSALGPRKKLGRRLQLFLAKSKRTDASGQQNPENVNNYEVDLAGASRQKVFSKPRENVSLSATAEEATAVPKKVWDIFSPSFRANPVARSGKKPVAKPSFNGSSGSGERGARQHAFSHRVSGTSFTVDSFRGPKSDPCRRFFLTHFHSDHYGGLSKKSMAPGGIVLCTSVTASLVNSLLRVPVDRIQVLPSDGRSVDVPDTVDGKNGVTVRCFDANHCPGAVVMLFFVWKTKRYILHSGDCRYDPAVFSKHKALADIIAAGQLDFLHLDTTYCNPRYVFPYQPTILEGVVKAALQEDKRTRGRCLFFFGTYSIGKEKVFMAVARALNLHLYCSKRKRGILEALDIPGLKDRLVDKPGAARVHILSMRDLSCDGIKSHAKYSGLNRDFIGKGLAVIMKPTGWTYSASGGDGVRRSVRTADQAVTYDVAYSEHSSYSELRDFVAWARPARLIPTVNCKSASDAEKLQNLLGHRNRSLRLISSGPGDKSLRQA